MKPSICLKNIWFDNDVIELNITTKDGNSTFAINVYVSYQALDDVIQDMNIFKNQVYSGLFDMNFGSFGPEWANGAFSARLHFQKRGKIYISVRMQSNFFDFGKKNVASEAFLYLISEPALLNKFLNELKSIQTLGNIASLECIEQ